MEKQVNCDHCSVNVIGAVLMQYVDNSVGI